MPLFIDDQAVPLAAGDAAGAGTLAAALAAAQHSLADSERVVVEVQLDGGEVTGDELERLSGESVEGREVRLYTADPRALAADTLTQLRDRLADAGVSLERAGELFQEDEGGLAIERVNEGLEVWRQTQAAVLHVAVLLRIDLDAIEIDAEPAPRIIEELRDRLTNLMELIRDRDPAALGDTLMHEWPQTTAKWDRLLAAVIDRARP